MFTGDQFNHCKLVPCHFHPSYRQKKKIKHCSVCHVKENFQYDLAFSTGCLHSRKVYTLHKGLEEVVTFLLSSRWISAILRFVHELAGKTSHVL